MPRQALPTFRLSRSSALAPSACLQPFALLLHQGLSRYATNTSVTVQREWKKIEGRFETIQFVDDSKELYQLIGQIMRQIRSNGPPSRRVLDRGLSDLSGRWPVR